MDLVPPGAWRVRYGTCVQAWDVEVWQLVDEHLNEVRRRTRVVELPRDRLGISVRVDVERRRPRAEADIVITSTATCARVVSQRRLIPARVSSCAERFLFGPAART